MYKEIHRLAEMLTAEKIPHALMKLFDGWKISYKEGGIEVLSVIEHQYSYGSDEDRLEIMGLLTPAELEEDLVKGHLTAEEVFNRIKKHNEEANNG